MIDTLVAVLFFAGAALGHVTLLVRVHNWCYGQALPRRATDVIQVVCGLLVLTGLAALWLAGPDLRPLLFASDVTPLGRGLGVYAVVCCLLGFVVLPAVTVARLRRRCPALAHNHTETVDVAARLGVQLVGSGKHRLLARLPGNQIFQVDLAERTLLLPQLPAEWDGLTILHLSDLHLCGTPSAAYFEYVLDRCREWQPDSGRLHRRPGRRSRVSGVGRAAAGTAALAGGGTGHSGQPRFLVRAGAGAGAIATGGHARAGQHLGAD